MRQLSSHCSIPLFLSMLFLPLLMNAQSTMKPAAIASTGVAFGETPAKQVFSVSGGVSYGNRFFTGIGVGYDRYRFNTVPVFADWRMDFGSGKVVFVYANAGYNFAGGGKQSDVFFDKNIDRLKGGAYFDGGLGYRLPLKNVPGFSLSAGFSRKNLDVERETVNPCLIPPCPVTISEYKYGLGRFMARLSWQIGGL